MSSNIQYKRVMEDGGDNQTKRDHHHQPVEEDYGYEFYTDESYLQENSAASIGDDKSMNEPQTDYSSSPLSLENLGMSTLSSSSGKVGGEYHNDQITNHKTIESALPSEGFHNQQFIQEDNNKHLPFEEISFAPLVRQEEENFDGESLLSVKVSNMSIGPKPTRSASLYAKRSNSVSDTSVIAISQSNPTSALPIRTTTRTSEYFLFPKLELSSSEMESGFNSTQLTTTTATNGKHFEQRHHANSTARRLRLSRQRKIEIIKVVSTFLYMFLVMGFHSFVLVLSHERVPAKYPPLPDIILDNLPLVPWAFKGAEVILVLLMAIVSSIVLFHKQRLIIMRRAFALMGTAYLLRSLTAVSTSLSVPAVHLNEFCSPLIVNSTQERFDRAVKIWLGFGMTIQGVRTCGDYMFSGHTVSLTLMNFFISEYTPGRWYPLHAIAWIANIAGMFLILAAKEHYTIDVIVAFYISMRLFLSYHYQANHNPLTPARHRRRWHRRIWFPIWSLLESDSSGRVRNEYEIPFSKWLMARRCIYRA